MCTRHEVSKESKDEKQSCPYGKDKNEQKPDKWYSRLLRGGARPSRRDVTTATAEEEDEAFWFKFYRAYDALCTPVILGEIERKSLDVIIVYANTAACDFTGYDPGEMSKESNPDGIIGRSVTELMEQRLCDNHAGFVASWLSRRDNESAPKRRGSSDGNAHIEKDDSGMKEVEGISRRVMIVTKNGKSVSTDAALSFFTSSGLKKVVGIFSFKEAEELQTLSFEGLSFALEYKPANSGSAISVDVETPNSLSDFESDKKWRIVTVSQGVELTEKDRAAIKRLIRTQIFNNLGSGSCGSGLDVSFVETDKHSLSDASVSKISSTLVTSINSAKCAENMYLSVSTSRADFERDGILSLCSVEISEQKH
jgi:hypothetical protein